MLTNDALTDDVLTNDVLTNDALTDDVLTNDALTNDVLTKDALTDDVLTNDALTDEHSGDPRWLCTLSSAPSSTRPLCSMFWVGRTLCDRSVASQR